MKKRFGFVSNSSSTDFIVNSSNDEDTEDENDTEYIPTVNDLIEYGSTDCTHFFVSRTDYNEERKDIEPAICMYCGAFADWYKIETTTVGRVNHNMDENMSAEEFSFFKNPMAKKKFNEILKDNKIKELIIL